jgi:hypothetical protein
VNPENFSARPKPFVSLIAWAVEKFSTPLGAIQSFGHWACEAKHACLFKQEVEIIFIFVVNFTISSVVIASKGMASCLEIFDANHYIYDRA